MSRLRIWLMAFIVLALSLSPGPMVGKAYAQSETGEVEEGIDVEGAYVDVEDSGICAFKKSQFVAGIGGITTSTTFVPVPYANITFTNRKTSCFRITFSAEAFTSAEGNAMFVEARVDGIPAVPTTAQQFVASTGTFADYHTAVWTQKDVAPGTHRVEMFFRSFDGTNVALNEFHLSVDYKK